MNQELNFNFDRDPLADQLRDALREVQSLRHQLDAIRARARTLGVLEQLERPRKAGSIPDGR